MEKIKARLEQLEKKIQGKKKYYIYKITDFYNELLENGREMKIDGSEIVEYVENTKNKIKNYNKEIQDLRRVLEERKKYLISKKGEEWENKNIK